MTSILTPTARLKRFLAQVGFGMHRGDVELLLAHLEVQEEV